MDKKMLRQFLIDTESLLREQLTKITQIKDQLDEETGNRIEEFIREKFIKECRVEALQTQFSGGDAKNQIIRDKYKLHKKVVKRLLKQIRQEIFKREKKESLGMWEMMPIIKKMPEEEKLDVIDYCLQQLKIEKLTQKVKSASRSKVPIFENSQTDETENLIQENKRRWEKVHY